METLLTVYKRVGLSGEQQPGCFVIKSSRVLKGKFYRVAIRLALFYGTECWPVKKAFEQRMEVT